MRHKRGELTSEQLIALILVAAGFIVILAFFTQLGVKDYTDDELCKFSVVSRATAEEVKAGTGSMLPLQCTTKKICISSTGKGDCAQFAGEKDVLKIGLPSYTGDNANSITLAANEIARVNAESLYTCWNMMGQGKLDLFNSLPETLGYKFFEESTCVICTRVAVANDVNDYVLARVNVSDYMRRNTVPGSTKTYVEAMTDETTGTYPKIDESRASSSQALAGPEENPREIAFVFSQLKSGTISSALSNQLQLGTAALSTGAVLSPSTAMAFVLKKGSLTYMAAAAGTSAAVGALGAWSNQRAAVAYCGELTTKEKDKNGCSLVQMVNYNVDDIKNICGSLQGNP